MSELTHQGAFRLIYKRRRTGSEESTLRGHLQHCPDCRHDAEMAGLFTDNLVLKTLPTRPSPQFTAVYREQAARRSRRSHIMKPIYAVGGAVALALLMLAGWFIIRNNIQTTGLLEAPQLPAVSVSEPQVESQPDIDMAVLDKNLITAIDDGDAAEAARLMAEGVNPDLIRPSGYPILKTAVIDAAESGEYDIVRLLLENGADVNQLDGSGSAILPAAAGSVRVALVQLLLEAGADANGSMYLNPGIDRMQTLSNAPAIIHAVIGNKVEIVQLLIDHGADPDQTEAGGYRTALYVAAALNHPNIIEALLENGADPDPLGSQTPLQIAAEYHEVDSAIALMEGGADPNVQREDQGKTALMYAAGGVPSTPILRTLLEGGADPNQTDDGGSTVLHHAVRGGSEDVVPFLIENGAAVDAQDNMGNSALHLAAQRGRVIFAGNLIDMGASLHLQNDEGKTPLDLAANEQTAELLREAGAVEGSGAETAMGSLDEQLAKAIKGQDTAAVEQLIDAGANVNVPDNYGNALLALAADDGQLEVVQLLLDAGADVNGTLTDSEAKDSTGLLEAAVKNHIDVVSLLIENGADVNRAEALYNRTALHGAAWYNNAEIVTLLLESGADPNPQSTYNDGETPLHFAARNGSLEAVQALLDGGVDPNIQIGSGETPMMQVFRDSTLLTLLLENGANPDIQDNRGNTVLHRSVLSKNKNPVSILLEHGADLNVENNEGKTPLDIATTDPIAEMLNEAGAE